MSRNKHTNFCSPQAYFASPLFSEAERAFNISVANQIEEFISVYLPQRDGKLMSEMIANGVPIAMAMSRVFREDLDAIRKSDLVIAVLDGRTIDEGVAFELGVAFAQNNLCIGLQTDSRRLAVWGNNPMIAEALETILMSVDELVNWIKCMVSQNSSCLARDFKESSTCVFP